MFKVFIGLSFFLALVATTAYQSVNASLLKNQRDRAHALSQFYRDVAVRGGMNRKAVIRVAASHELRYVEEGKGSEHPLPVDSPVGAVYAVKIVFKPAPALVPQSFSVFFFDEDGCHIAGE